MRVASGIPGLDNLIDGGIPEKSVVLVSGEVGTGKTIFGLQFLCLSKDPGVFVSFEEDIDQLRETAKAFGWDIARMEKEKTLKLVKFDPYRLEDILDVLENSIREIKAKRIVIDSISALGIYVREISDIRHIIIQMGNAMKKNKCTALLLSEIPHKGMLSRFGVEEFVSDGVIVLEKSVANNKYARMLSVLKMRTSTHSKDRCVYDITKKGIVIK
jgi:KaiC/GvpD/RAD55 family RecA-like ATPase